jgi:hypothetical protein
VAGLIPEFDTGAQLADTSAGAELAWEKAEAEIMLLNTPTHQIATVWHPEARGDVVTTAHGNVRALIGDTAEYQLSTGEKIAL